MIVIARIVFILVLSSIIPLAYQPLRRTMENLYIFYKSQRPVAHLAASINEEELHPLAFPSKRFKLFGSITVAVIVVGISVLVPSVKEAVALTGACCSAILNFTLPGLMYLKTIPEASFLQKLRPRMLILLGLFSSFSTIIASLVYHFA
eukprot:TRINITY_DN9819_c0_g1_i1.p1 TRINITY_DN9819_c0_g1~~TRINITY_DN9819_c0_g1_i1.p1  ORF type:complete len:149 (+),score=19.68 TRINITY_DN9819_c0_g1_i1:193-639(+)